MDFDRYSTIISSCNSKPNKTLKNASLVSNTDLFIPKYTDYIYMTITIIHHY